MYRSREHRIIAGVCGGLAEKWGWRPNAVRLLFLLSCLLPGPQFVIYLLLWLLMPKAPKGGYVAPAPRRHSPRG